MRQLPWERERGEVNHEKITVRDRCRWRTLKPLGNTGPMRPAEGNSPGEAELSNGPASLGLGLGYILCSQLADYSTGPKADRNAQREATS